MCFYSFEFVVSTNRKAFYKKTSDYIELLDDLELSMKLGGEYRVESLKNHFAKVSQNCLCFIVTKEDPSMVHALLTRLNMIEYFSGDRENLIQNCQNNSETKRMCLFIFIFIYFYFFLHSFLFTKCVIK